MRAAWNLYSVPIGGGPPSSLEWTPIQISSQGPRRRKMRCSWTKRQSTPAFLRSRMGDTLLLHVLCLWAADDHHVSSVQVEFGGLTGSSWKLTVGNMKIVITNRKAIDIERGTCCVVLVPCSSFDQTIASRWGHSHRGLWWRPGWRWRRGRMFQDSVHQACPAKTGMGLEVYESVSREEGAHAFASGQCIVIAIVCSWQTYLQLQRLERAQGVALQYASPSTDTRGDFHSRRSCTGPWALFLVDSARSRRPRMDHGDGTGRNLGGRSVRLLRICDVGAPGSPCGRRIEDRFREMIVWDLWLLLSLFRQEQRRCPSPDDNLIDSVVFGSRSTRWSANFSRNLTTILSYPSPHPRIRSPQWSHGHNIAG